ncbi:uncharacterized protein N7515_008854 [Penicillium bovifimosum]|uniref:Secreted protein n=1 Tax=Penicillium bovifimosum TaxID=126998 RepID=A0A9W9GP22_9EURO|nr:uncharacterized protein N7515_008854 [Penicillium bovifimosum]KAJ5125029.1 hypothetical protein N7515_008854 [Penicillium bovifimosum]
MLGPISSQLISLSLLAAARGGTEVGAVGPGSPIGPELGGGKSFRNLLAARRVTGGARPNTRKGWRRKASSLRNASSFALVSGLRDVGVAEVDVEVVSVNDIAGDDVVGVNGVIGADVADSDNDAGVNWVIGDDVLTLGPIGPDILAESAWPYFLCASLLQVA